MDNRTKRVLNRIKGITKKELLEELEIVRKNKKKMKK